MKTIIIFLLFVGTVFGQKTYTGVSGDWNVSGNWDPTGVPTASDDVIIGSATVTITANAFAKSISIAGTGILQLNNGVTLTVTNNVTVQIGGTFYMPVSPDKATLLVYGNYTNIGVTDFRVSDVVVSGDVVSATATQIFLQGNLVVGGNIAGVFDTDGGNGFEQIYATNPNAQVNIFPYTVDDNVTPGILPVSPPESPQLLAAVDTVIYGGTNCSGFSASTANKTACVGDNTTLSVTTAASSPTFQWQVNKNDVNGWTNLSDGAPYSGVTLQNLSITNVTLAMNNYHYRAYVTSGGCSEYGSYGILNVNNPSITPTFTPVPAICMGDALTSLLTTSNNGIAGSWSPALDNSITTTYTFTPNPGQCASSTTLTIVVNDCSEIMLPSIESYIYCPLVKKAQYYTWEATTLNESGVSTGEVQTRQTPLRQFKISWLNNFLYNTKYSVRVAATVDGIMEPYSTPIIVNTPNPSSNIVDVCGTTIETLNTQIFSTIVRYTPGYRYTLTNTVSPFDTHSIEFELRVFRLNQMPDLLVDRLYNVTVEVKNMNGVYLPIVSSPCQITIPGGTSRFLPSESENSTQTIFDVISYPNPFSNDFSINLSTTNQDKVQISVYDMIGRMVEQRSILVNDFETIKFGNQYQSGIYNIVVSQGTNSKSLRMIKR